MKQATVMMSLLLATALSAPLAAHARHGVVHGPAPRMAGPGRDGAVQRTGEQAMNRTPAGMADTRIGQQALRLVCLCASFNPALAGLPHLLEYLWNYMLSASHPTSNG